MESKKEKFTKNTNIVRKIGCIVEGNMTPQEEAAITEYSIAEEYFYNDRRLTMEEALKVELRSDLLGKLEKDEYLCKNVPMNQVESIFDRYADIQIDGEEPSYGRIFVNVKRNTGSTVKVANVLFSLRDSIADIVSMALKASGLTLEKSIWNIMTVLHIIHQCYDMLKVKLDREAALTALALHKMNGYECEISFEGLKNYIEEDMGCQISEDKLYEALGELEKLKCIEGNDNKFRLLERVSININR